MTCRTYEEVDDLVGKLLQEPSPPRSIAAAPLERTCGAQACVHGTRAVPRRHAFTDTCASATAGVSGT